MTPLKLTMRAFGPYAGETVIDFDKLDGRHLFLICGPTGAGKTTILDAMCYALYGKTSGDRTGSHMRSDYASTAQKTEVILISESAIRPIGPPGARSRPSTRSGARGRQGLPCRPPCRSWKRAGKCAPSAPAWKKQQESSSASTPASSARSSSCPRGISENFW